MKKKNDVSKTEEENYDSVLHIQSVVEGSKIMYTVEMLGSRKVMLASIIVAARRDPQLGLLLVEAADHIVQDYFKTIQNTSVKKKAKKK